jgi:hypothetical protein
MSGMQRDGADSIHLEELEGRRNRKIAIQCTVSFVKIWFVEAMSNGGRRFQVDPTLNTTLV